MPQEEKKGPEAEAAKGPEKTNNNSDNNVVIIDGMRCAPRYVVINEHYYPSPAPVTEPAPAPKVCCSPTPINVVTQQTVGGASHFPNWVIGLIVAILLLLLAYGGYILYQSGKDATPAPAPTPTVKVINSGGGSKIAVDPEARVSAAEANVKADFNSQKISDLEEEQRRQQQITEEKNKKDCNSSDWLTF